jgi:hypothetical protein
MYSIAYMRKTRSAARLSGLKRRITTVNGASDKEWDECLPASSGTAKHFSGSKAKNFLGLLGVHNSIHVTPLFSIRCEHNSTKTAVSY